MIPLSKIFLFSLSGPHPDFIYSNPLGVCEEFYINSPRATFLMDFLSRFGKRITYPCMSRAGMSAAYIGEMEPE